MKKLLYIALGAIIAIPSIAWGINVSVPQSTQFGVWLRGNANGTYTPVATSTLGLDVSSFASPNISQWTNNSGYLTNLFGSLTKGNFLVGNDAGVAQATSSIFVSSTGNVGIGTTIPSAMLDISNAATGGTDYFRVSPAGNYLIKIGDGSINTYYGNNQSTAKLLTLQSNGGVTSFGGNVGIGTTTPYSKLSVWGSGTGTTNLFELTNRASTSLMVVKENGNVGIGTTNPLYNLDILGSISGGKTVFHLINNNDGLGHQGGDISLVSERWGEWGFYIGDITDVNNRLFYGGGGYTSFKSYSAGIDFQNNTQGSLMRILQNGNVGIGTTTPYSKLSVWGTSTGTNRMFELTNSASTTLMSMLENGTAYFSGNVGIGTTSPATALDVNGTITQKTVKSCSLGLTTNALGSITGCVASDQSLKKNIQPLASSLEKLLKLSPVTYQWKDTSKDTMTHSGFIAQSVEKVFPSAVVSAGTNLKGVDSNAILSLVVKSIQDFYADFQKLVARVSGLEKKVNDQEKRIQELEKALNKLTK